MPTSQYYVLAYLLKYCDSLYNENSYKIARPIFQAIFCFLVGNLERIPKRVLCRFDERFIYSEHVNTPRHFLRYLSNTCGKIRMVHEFQENLRYVQFWCRPVRWAERRALIHLLQSSFQDYGCFLHRVSMVGERCINQRIICATQALFWVKSPWAPDLRSKHKSAYRGISESSPLRLVIFSYFSRMSSLDDHLKHFLVKLCSYIIQ